MRNSIDDNNYNTILNVVFCQGKISFLRAIKHQLVLKTTTTSTDHYSPNTQILHPRLEIIIIRYVQGIPKKLCSRNEAKKAIQRHPIIMTDADYDYILDEIERREKIEFERNVSFNSDEE